ncbi:MAG: aminopeptidase P family protein [Rhodospirillaceae bacterium]|nr:MAG: aminopeptidase P family protein [Rhodospirillaceae bacterium]
MSVCRENYQGDESLQMLLKKGRSFLTLDELSQAIPGIAAAPQGELADDWIHLVVPEASPATKAQLNAYLELWKTANRGMHDAKTADRLAALQKEMLRRGMDGFVIPRADEHQGEYVPKRAERLAWISNFTGSAGLVIVLKDRAAIFVDGRYTIQVREQVDAGLFDIRHITNEPPEAWIAEYLPKGGKLGIDPWLVTADMAQRFRAAVQQVGGELVSCDSNPLDAVWPDRPAAPIAPVWPQDLRYAGRSSADKRQELGARLAAQGRDAAVLTAPDSFCWLLNIRGGDVPRTPFALGFAILHQDGRVDLFMDRRKFPPATLAHLGNQVTLQAPEAFTGALDALGAARAKVIVDAATAGIAVSDRLRAAGAAVTVGEDPCALPKAAKNEVEIAGTRAAHRRDGAAVAQFLAWLDAEAPKGHLTELAAVDKLAEFRRRNDLFRDFSFDTISGAGPNAAIPHYRVTPESDRRIERDAIYLVDSGGQYLDGTTDITRTIVVGTPTSEMKDRFTRVLKGHIALATAKFPRGTSGSQLDSLARRPLWDAGLDFDHGTGHGVGSYLSVHEGPQRISKVPNRVALEPGMILSNEPGYYKAGEYGIRIENLIVVQRDPGSDMLSFETITFAPIDLALVDTSIMTPEEIAWLNAYHAEVREKLLPQLDEPTAAWLQTATRAI